MTRGKQQQRKSGRIFFDNECVWRLRDVDMGIECGIYPPLQGDNLLGRAIRTKAIDRDFGVHVVIIDATTIIQGSLINTESGSFGRCKGALIGTMIDLVKRYPNVSTLAYICDTSIRVPCAKSIEHTEERGRTAYTGQELVDMGVLVPRYDEGSETPSYYEMNERFPLDMVPPGWNWRKAWHTAPTRRRMESMLGNVILDAAATVRPPSDKGWPSTRLDELDAAVALGMGEETYHAFMHVMNGIESKTRQSGPAVYADSTLPEAEKSEVYRPLHVCMGVDPRTGEPVMCESLACLDWSDVQSHPVRRVFMGERDKIEYVHDHGGQGRAGEYDLRALDWIAPEYGDGMVIYSDDSDMVPIVLLHLMRIECARLGIPLSKGDVERYKGWFPRRVWIDRMCSASVKNSDNEALCRAVDVGLLFSQLMYDCTETLPEKRAQWCCRRISAFALALIFCGTDYCPRLGKIFNRMHLPDDEEKRRPNFVLDVRECLNLAIRNPVFMNCIDAFPLRGTLHVTVSSERLLYMVLQMTAQAVAKSHKSGRSLAAMGPYKPEYDMDYIREAWDSLHAAAVPPPSGRAYVSVPTFDVAYHQSLRWLWNYFYWRDGFKDETPYHVTRWLPVQGVSAFGWQLGRIVDPAEVNLLDISQYVFPLPGEGEEWPHPEFDRTQRLGVWRTCRQYGTQLVGEQSIAAFRKESSR